jgi:hypothetical protein
MVARKDAGDYKEWPPETALEKLAPKDTSLRFGDARPTVETGNDCPKYRATIFVWVGSHEALSIMSDDLYTEMSRGETGAKRLTVDFKRKLVAKPNYRLTTALAGSVAHELEHVRRRIKKQPNTEPLVYLKELEVLHQMMR